MPTRLNAKMIGNVTAIGWPATGAKMPKYSEIMTAMKAQSSIMNLPCVTRYVLHVS